MVEEAVTPVCGAYRMFVLECTACAVGSISCSSLAPRQRRWMLREQVTVFRDRLAPIVLRTVAGGSAAK